MFSLHVFFPSSGVCLAQTKTRVTQTLNHFISQPPGSFFDFLANYVQSSQSQHGLLVCNPDLIANCPHLGSPPELRREIALQEETIFFFSSGTDLFVHLAAMRKQAVIYSIGCHTGAVLGTKCTANTCRSRFCMLFQDSCFPLQDSPATFFYTTLVDRSVTKRFHSTFIQVLPHQNKMQPTNPNAHTYDNGTESETRRYGNIKDVKECSVWSDVKCNV